MTDERRDPSRREVVAQLAGLAALTPLGGCAALGLGGGPREIAPVDQVPPGSALRTVVDGHRLIVLNVAGAVKAYSGLCTHESCELGWNPRQQLIRCPCHGSAFDTDGKVNAGPATEPLASYPVTVRDGRIYLQPGAVPRP